MNVLYLSYTGLAEPLGDSQVLAYLRGSSWPRDVDHGDVPEQKK